MLRFEAVGCDVFALAFRVGEGVGSWLAFDRHLFLEYRTHRSLIGDFPAASDALSGMNLQPRALNPAPQTSNSEL